MRLSRPELIRHIGGESMEKRVVLRLLTGTAVALALLASGQILAQETEEILVTGSRIRTDGFESPNPVTVVTPEEWQLTSPATLIEGVAELPQFYQSNTTENPGNFFQTPGAGTLNLRGLQGKRTLTLLSSRRVAPSTLFGGPDINLFPEEMLRSVETVTGGATAAYGTDAVAGVVNFILNTDYEGVKGHVQGGTNYKGDADNWEGSLSAGFDLGERSHVLVSAERAKQDPIFGKRADYDWYQGWGLLENPDVANRGTSPDNPYYLAYPHVVSRKSSLDGIIHFAANSGVPAGQRDWILQPDGTAIPFVLGDAFDNSAHSIANGGTGTDNGEPASSLMPKSDRTNFFGYIDYDLTDNLTVYGQAIYGEASFTQTNAGGYFNGLNLPANTPAQRSFTIFNGNAFLPANIQALMTQYNVASVAFGRVGAPEDLAFDAFTTQDTDVLSLTGGFDWDIDGGFFDGWAVGGYFQVGRTDVKARQRGGIRLDHVYLAVDAVRDANGNIVCNVTLVSGLYPDCVPLNLFGRGRASGPAVDWSTGFVPGNEVCVEGWLPGGETLPYCYTSSEEKVRDIDLDQEVFEIAADGDIWEGFGAGPVSLALGFHYRNESLIQGVQAPEGNPTADHTLAVLPVAANNAALGIRGVPGGAFASGNSVEIMFSKVSFAKGSFDVKEAFSELRVPLLADLPVIQELTVTGAGRWADYEGSGSIWSWKAGVEWTVWDEFRIRSTVSRDVRAANFAERFDQTGGLASIIDRLENPAGGAAVTYLVTTVSGGNPEVSPEKAKTYTAGFVYRPNWLEGLSLSLDWYQINVRDNINLAAAQSVVDGCYLDGDVDLCALIIREGDPSPILPGVNRISLLNAVYINVNSQRARGVDFELAYNTDVEWFGGGERVGLRLIGSWLDENSSTNSAGVKTETTELYSLPEWSFNVAGNYTRGPLSASLQGRYTGETYQNLNRNFLGASTRWDVADNTVNAEVLVDLAVSYRFRLAETDITLFGNVNNLFNEGPQAFYGTFDSFGEQVGNGYVGDLRGRRYTIGMRFEY
jgi:outer membrane receptor protein involved in Fe transport